MQRNHHYNSNGMRGLAAARAPVRSIHDVLLIEPNDFQRGDSSALASNNLQRDTTTSVSSVPRRRKNVMDLENILNPSGPLTATTAIDHDNSWKGTALQPLPRMQVQRLLSFTLEPNPVRETMDVATTHTAETREVVDEMGRAWLARDILPCRPASTNGAEAGAAGQGRNATPSPPTPKENVWPPAPLTPLSTLSLTGEAIDLDIPELDRRDMALPRHWLGPAPKRKKCQRAHNKQTEGSEHEGVEGVEVDDDGHDADSESSPTTPTHPIFCDYLTESPLPLTPDEWPGVHSLENDANPASLDGRGAHNARRPVRVSRYIVINRLPVRRRTTKKTATSMLSRSHRPHSLQALQLEGGRKSKRKGQKHTTAGIPTWSPTVVLIGRFAA